MMPPSSGGPYREHVSYFPPPGTNYPPPAPAYGAPAWGRIERPTDVFGRRIGAFFIDLAPLVIAFIVMVNMYVEIVNQPSASAAETFCTRINDRGSDEVCVPGDGEAYLFTNNEILAMLSVFGGYLLVNHVLLTGLTGASIGKAMVGIRCVKASTGERCGVPRALLRTVLLLVPDTLLCFPLVGLLVGALTEGHRRVGDFAAGTAVVGKQWVGRPALQAQAVAGYNPLGPPAAGYPPPAVPYAPPGQYAPPVPNQQWPPPPPASPPTSPTPPPGGAWSVPIPASPAPTPTPEPTSVFDTPILEPTTVTPAIDTPALGTPAIEADEPQAGVGAPLWDDARNAYIQWDPDVNAWMQWDDVASEWKPISQ